MISATNALVSLFNVGISQLTGSSLETNQILKLMEVNLNLVICKEISSFFNLLFLELQIKTYTTNINSGQNIEYIYFSAFFLRNVFAAGSVCEGFFPVPSRFLEIHQALR